MQAKALPVQSLNLTALSSTSSCSASLGPTNEQCIDTAPVPSPNALVPSPSVSPYPLSQTRSAPLVSRSLYPALDQWLRRAPLRQIIAFQGSVALPTRWSRSVSSSSVWQEYPRPQLRRQQWLNLNGEWELQEVTNEDAPPPFGETLPERILVPFPIESDLSGVCRPLGTRT